jgi:response regulator NasT
MDSSENPKLPGRVLVAEDEHLVAVHLMKSLKQLGIEIVGPAANGELAIDVARKEKPDLAILDIRMPQVDGIKAAEVLWNELQIPVVILSAFSDDRYIKAATDAGVFGYLLKPAMIEDLRAALAVAWSRYLEWSQRQAND